MALPKTEKRSPALASVAQLVGYYPTNQKVAGSIPNEGTCLDCGLGALPPHVASRRQEASTAFSMFLSHTSISLPFFLSPFPSLSNKILKALKKRERESGVGAVAPLGPLYITGVPRQKKWLK